MRRSLKLTKSILAALDRIFGWIDIFVYVCMISVVLLQIFARVFLPRVPSWTEELSRYLQVYLVAFGAGLAIKHDAFVSVETIFHYLNKKAGILLKIFNHAVVFAMFAYFFRYSIDFYKLGIPRSTVTMPSVTMNMIYFSMMFMSASVLFYILRKEAMLVMEFRTEGKEKC